MKHSVDEILKLIKSLRGKLQTKGEERLQISFPTDLKADWFAKTINNSGLGYTAAKGNSRGNVVVYLEGRTIGDIRRIVREVLEEASGVMMHYGELGNAACGYKNKGKNYMITTVKKAVTCPKCLKILRQKEEDKNLGNFEIADNRVGTAKVLRRKNEGVMKLSAPALGKLVNEVLKDEVTTTMKNGCSEAKVKPKKLPPASLTKQIVSALTSLGFKVVEREKTLGAYKVWLNVIADNELKKDTKKLADVCNRALQKLGRTTVISDNYESVIRGEGFEVIIPSASERQSYGSHLFVKMFIQSKNVVREAAHDDEKYMSEDDAETFIASMDGDAIAKYSVIDEDTGEIYLEEGQPFNTSRLSPDYVNINRNKFGKRIEPVGDVEEEDEEEDYWDLKEKERLALEAEYRNALQEFCSNWTNFQEEMPDTSPEDAASDAADGFFFQYPQWKNWARSLEMTRQSMKAAIADYVYEAMVSGTIPEV